MKIGFVTDLHYREALPGDSPHPQRELRRVGALLRHCLQHFRSVGVELVLVAGDNVDVPPTGQNRTNGGKGGAALAGPLDDPRLDADLVSLREMLTGSGLPFVIIPGNHDPAPEVFYRVLPRPPRVLRSGKCEIVTFGDDTFDAEAQHASRRAEVLAEMRQLLSSTPAGVELTILLQHYVLYPEQEHHGKEYRYNYLNDAEIRAIMEASPRRLLSLSGHLHRGHPLVTHNGVAYFIGGALCEHPFRYYLLHTDTAEITVQECRAT